MSSDCVIPADGFSFSREEIAQCVSRQGLLSLEIELTPACNFHCPTCYLGDQPKGSGLSHEQICDAIGQARDLGARRIILFGGEPTLYPRLRDVIDFIRTQKLEIELFTNGGKIDAEMARFLHDRDVAVVLRLDTLDRQVQNRLAGCGRGYDIIHEALAKLWQAGYPDPARGKRLATSTVICDDNFDEMPDLWRWIRTRGMAPYVEIFAPRSGAPKNGQELRVSSDRLKRLFDALSDIDRAEFGRKWEPQPPLGGDACKRNLFSCVVRAGGEVFSCVGLTIPLGNIREQPLRNILHASEVLENLRNYRMKIKEPCRSCFKAEDCYGCRGAAYQLTGDYLAADPSCWHAAGAAIDVLPVEVAGLIPHGPAIRMVDRLAEVGERQARTELTVPADSPLVDADGRLDETAYVEMIAQSLAACYGFHLSRDEEHLHAGFLLGIKALTVCGEVRAGDRLQIHVRKLARYGDLGVAEGTIRVCDGPVVARGEIKIWQSSRPPQGE